MNQEPDGLSRMGCQPDYDVSGNPWYRFTHYQTRDLEQFMEDVDGTPRFRFLCDLA